MDSRVFLNYRSRYTYYTHEEVGIVKGWTRTANETINKQRISMPSIARLHFDTPYATDSKFIQVGARRPPIQDGVLCLNAVPWRGPHKTTSWQTRCEWSFEVDSSVNAMRPARPEDFSRVQEYCMS